jgi:phosphatidylglycerol:prolipoprotein diacylglycerol transferase
VGPFIDLGFFSIRTYTALVGAAVLAGFGALIVAARRADTVRPLRWIDVGLGALIGGVIGARLGHVLLYWAYFADHPGEMVNLQAGGLSWHGAVIGGLIGGWLAARWRRVPFRIVADVLAVVWPVGVMAVWWGCAAAHCGYGAEVWTLADYPAWMVSERADVFGVVVPRYNVQTFGMWLGVGLFGLAIVLAWRDWLRGFRLWLLLVLTGIGMLIIGFYRGDGMPGPVPGLTLDQALDLVVIGIGAGAAAVTARPGKDGQ